MGYIVNPISFRLGNFLYWSSKWVVFSKKTTYYNILYQDLLIKNYIENFFRKFYKKNYLELIYDKTDIIRYNNKFFVVLYLYDFKALNDLSEFLIDVDNICRKYFYKFFDKFLKINGNTIEAMRIYYFIYICKKLGFKKFFKFYYKLLIHFFKKSINYVNKGINNSKLEFKIKFIYDELISAQFIANFIVRKVRYDNFDLMYILKFVLGKVNQLNISGIKIQCAGRVSRKQRASKIKLNNGSIHYSSFNKNVDYGKSILRTRHGIGGIKIWIYRPKLKYIQLNNVKKFIII